ncbi:MAG: hypothetical protein WHT84_11055, partial [Breznakiellaceae bacterium]
MTVNKNRLGLSLRVRLEWLEQTAHLLLAGNDEKIIHEALQDLLKDQLSIGSKSKRSSRDKVISILQMVWLNPIPEIQALRAEGLQFLAHPPEPLNSRDISRIVHWGMMMAVYPFWTAVATQTGRLLRLQGSATASQIQRRLRELYGERESVSKATRRVLRSFVDWGVLQDTEKIGIYTGGTSQTVEDPRLIAWLIEAFLRSKGNGPIPLKEII